MPWMRVFLYMAPYKQLRTWRKSKDDNMHLHNVTQKATNMQRQTRQNPDFGFSLYFHHRSDLQGGFWGKVVLPCPGTCVLAAPWHPRELGAAGASWAGRAGHGMASQSLSHCSSQRAGWAGGLAGQPGWAVSPRVRARTGSGEGKQSQRSLRVLTGSGWGQARKSVHGT